MEGGRKETVFRLASPTLEEDSGTQHEEEEEEEGGGWGRSGGSDRGGGGGGSGAGCCAGVRTMEGALLSLAESLQAHWH